MKGAELVIHARACIADSERTENSLATRTDAAIQAIAFLDQALLKDPGIQEYLGKKYERPLDEFDMLGYHAYAHALAKKLLSKVERTASLGQGAQPESAAELLAAAQTLPPEQISLFGQLCTPEDVGAVVNADDPLRAARDLLTKRLNEMALK